MSVSSDEFIRDELMEGTCVRAGFRVSIDSDGCYGFFFGNESWSFAPLSPTCFLIRAKCRDLGMNKQRIFD